MRQHCVNSVADMLFFDLSQANYLQRHGKFGFTAKPMGRVGNRFHQVHPYQTGRAVFPHLMCCST
jgi:hypothetical protein